MQLRDLCVRGWVVGALVLPLLLIGSAPSSAREVPDPASLNSPGDWTALNRTAWLERRHNALVGSLPLSDAAAKRFFEAFRYNLKENRAGEYQTVSQRHAYYDALSFTLHRGEDIPQALRCVRFFDAAADVTSSFNVGAVDLWQIIKEQARISAPTETLLQKVNEQLFKRNFGVTRKLLLEWKEPRDPLAATPTSRVDAMQFDLQMVRFEQGEVESFLKANPALVTQQVKKELSADHQFMDAAGVLLSGQAGSIVRRKDLRERWLPAVGIATFDFLRLDHRVALGEAYVFFMHGYDMAAFQEYRNRGTRPRASCKGVLPGVVARADGRDAEPVAQGFMDQRDFNRAVYVANGLFQARTEGASASIALAVVQAATQMGDALTTAEGKATAALKVVAAERDRWRKLGFDLGLDPVEEQRRLLEAVRKAGVLGTAQLASEVVRLLPSPEPRSAVAGGLDAKLRLETFQAAQAQLLGNAFEKYGGADSAYRGLYDRVVLPLLQARPNAAAAAILAANPKFASQPVVRAATQALQAAVRPDGTIAFDEAAKAALLATGRLSGVASQDVIKTSLALLGGQGRTRDQMESLLLGEVTRRTGVDARRAVAAARSLENGLSLGNAEAGVFLAETALGFMDPKAARDFGRIARTGIQIAQVFSAFSTGSGLTSSVVSLGAGAMTGGTLNAVMGIASMAGGVQQDSETKAMLEQIAAQIETVRQEMHARFDVVDAKLNTIHDTMVREFAVVRAQLGRVEADLSATRAELARVGQQLADAEARILAAIGDLHTALRASNLTECADWLDHTSTVAMGQETYITCMIRLYQWSTRLAALGVDVGTAVQLGSPAELAELGKEPTQNLAFWLAAAVQLGVPVIAPGEVSVPAEGTLVAPNLVAPPTWLATSRAYLRLADAFPNEYAQLQVARLEDIGEAGANTLARLDRLRSPTLGRPLFDRLIADMDSARSAFDAEVGGAWRKLLSDPKQWETSDRSPAVGIRKCVADQPLPANPSDPWGLPANAPERELSIQASPSLGPPPQLRLAEKLGLGTIRLCINGHYATQHREICALRIGNHCSQTTTKDVDPSVVEISLKMNFVFKDGKQVHVADALLRTRSAVDIPDDDVPGCWGVAGCPPDFHTKLNAYKRRWNDLVSRLWTEQLGADWAQGRATLDDLNSEALGQIGEAAVVASEDLRTSFRERAYATLMEGADEKIRTRLDALTRTSLRLRGFTRLAWEAEVHASETLSALVDGGARLVDRDEIAALRARGFDAWRLGSVAAQRSKAMAELVQAAFDAAQGKSTATAGKPADKPLAAEPGEDAVRQRMKLRLVDLGTLHEHEMQRCRSGQRPAANCVSQGRFP